MERKNKKTTSGKKLNYFSQGLVTSFALSGCGNEADTDQLSDENSVVKPDVSMPPVLSSGVNYIGESNKNELITTTYNILKTIDIVSDGNSTDKDQLDITTNQNVSTTPNISGFEIINFYLDNNHSTQEAIFNLENIVNSGTIIIGNTPANVSPEKVSILGAAGNLAFTSGFKDVDLYVKPGQNINVETSENGTINVFNSADSLTVNGGSKNISISTANLGNIDITNNSGISLSAPFAQGNLNVISNGDVTLTNAESVTGNVTIVGIGTIDIQDISSSTGKVTLNNLRAAEFDDISISNASLAKSIDIKSAGALNAILNEGFKSAEAIDITVSEDSKIFAVSETPKSVALNSVTNDGSEVEFDINIGSMTSLKLGGSSPVILKVSGDNLDGTLVTTSNSSTASIKMISASTDINTDISKVGSNIKVELPNLDGKVITVGNNQDLVVDAESPQTNYVGTTEYKFNVPANTLTTNSIKISTSDSDTTNITSTVNMSGLKLTDIQNLQIDLKNSVGLELSNDITGADLEKVVISGSGDFNLKDSTIVGVLDGSVSLESVNYTGDLTVSVDSTSSGIQTVKSGSGEDNIEIDTVTSSAGPIVVDAGAGHDSISITNNADGKYAKITVNGGSGVDSLTFNSGLDLSLSDLTLFNIETFQFTGGAIPVKLPTDVISGKNVDISENGTGRLILELFPTEQSINLATLTFDNSVAPSSDKIVINGSNFSQALTINGSIIGDEITGTFTSSDTINSGDGNDTINGRDGNDILTPGDGTDHITPGLGNDTVNLTELVAAVDTLYYSIDDGENNVDTVTNFDVRIANDIISLDASAASKPITFGNGTAVSAAALGTITVLEHDLDTNINQASSSSATIIKLTQTDQSDFATALGTSEITVANDATICFLWFDVDTAEAVFGYTNENIDPTDAEKITSQDTFTEIVRLSMSESSYTHFLDAENFIFT